MERERQQNDRTLDNGERQCRCWTEAIAGCPALRCAPLRKYIRWLPPFTHLNEAARPAEQHLSSLLAR